MHPTPPGDPDKPASARVYSYLLGGNDWYEADRELAEKLKAACPAVSWMARDNSVYLGHAALYATGRLGIRQVLDLGSGFPGPGSIREYAQAADPDAAVVCVDHDPLVAGPDGYGALLESQHARNVAMVQADVSDPARVLADPGVTGLIDLGRPVLAVLGLVANCWPPAEAREVVAGYAGALAAGSVVAVTLMRADEEAAFDEVADPWRCGDAPGPFNFSLEETAALLDGLDVLSPGVGPVAGCRPGWTSGSMVARGVHVAGGIGVKL